MRDFRDRLPDEDEISAEGGSLFPDSEIFESEALLTAAERRGEGTEEEARSTAAERRGEGTEEEEARSDLDPEF